MRAWIESVSASTAVVTIGWVNILEVLPLILEDARILEASTILQPCYIAAQHAGPASLQTADKDILIFPLIVVLHSRFVYRQFFKLSLLRRELSPCRQIVRCYSPRYVGRLFGHDYRAGGIRGSFNPTYEMLALPCRLSFRRQSAASVPLVMAT